MTPITQTQKICVFRSLSSLTELRFLSRPWPVEGSKGRVCRSLSLSKGRRGIAMPIIFGLVLCLAIWVASLSWTMTNSRARYQQVLKARKAYFMARSGMQHLFLKLKTMQRHCIEAMQAIENANDDEKKLLYSVFIEDIIVPPDDNYTGEKYEYRVNEFKVESIDHEESKLTLQVGVEGSFGGQKNSISRLIRISR